MHHYSRKSIIMKYTCNGNVMSRLLKRLLVAVVVFATFTGRLAAQNDPAYVIYTGSNYLAHVWDEGTHTWTLQGVHSFSPECVWYSPNTNNYYFIDENDGKLGTAVAIALRRLYLCGEQLQVSLVGSKRSR